MSRVDDIRIDDAVRPSNSPSPSLVENENPDEGRLEPDRTDGSPSRASGGTSRRSDETPRSRSVPRDFRSPPPAKRRRTEGLSEDLRPRVSPPQNPGHLASIAKDTIAKIVHDTIEKVMNGRVLSERIDREREEEKVGKLSKRLTTELIDVVPTGTNRVYTRSLPPRFKIRVSQGIAYPNSQQFLSC